MEQLIVQNAKGLPADMLQEILDFIQFLKFKQKAEIKNAIEIELSHFNASEFSQLEKDFFDYQTLYPKEI